MTLSDGDSIARASAPANPEANSIITEGYVFKTCKKSSLVVPRFLSLRQERFYTFHNYEENKSNKRSWEFSRNCRLEPRSADDIDIHEKTVRPQGQSTLQQLAKGGGKKLALFCFTVSWPTSWAIKKYTSFTMGTEKKEDAMRWHAFFSQQLTHVRQLRTAKGLHQRSTSRDSEFSVDMVPDLTPTVTPNVTPNVTPKAMGHRRTSSSLQDGGQESFEPAEQRTHRRGYSDDIPPLSSIPIEPQEPSSPESEAEVSLRPVLTFSPLIKHPLGPPSPTAAASPSASCVDSAISERWVPYKHVNGVAIYYNQSKLADGLGPEYMASSVVRGSPKECLDVLMDSSSLTTLLGPATHLAVLSGEDSQDTQVLRLQVDAPGLAGRVCAPREVLLERMYLRQEEDNIHVVMFASKDEVEVHRAATPAEVRHSGAVNPCPSWWRYPVQAHVKGGYTVAPLQGMGDESEESLVTCILHVDLGGCCSKRSWLHSISDICGFGDAFVERMLMGVILVKDEVEHRRFQLAPFTIMSPADAEEGEGEAPSMKRTTTMVVRKACKTRESRMASSVTLQRSHEFDKVGSPVSPACKLGAVFSCPSPVQMPTLGEDAPLEDAAGTLTMAPCTLDPKYWAEIHRNGAACPFKVRGPLYLKDRKKVQAGAPVFALGAVDLVMLDAPTFHVARYLPSIRKSKAPFSFVVQLIIPGTPVLGLVVTFVTEHHPDELGAPPGDPNHSGDWQPFDYLLYKFLNGSDEERNSAFKLIPHVAEGSWVIKQSVGTTPVIMGRKLKTTYHFTKRYVEVDVDISANATATYVVSMVRGALKGLQVDLGFVLEGQAVHELPESLVGAVRFKNMDLGLAVKIDTSKEIEMEDL